MKKLLGIGFWELIARVILRNRIVILGCIVLITVLLALHWKSIRFTQTEANLIPLDDKVNVDYQKFLDRFGEEGNLIVIATKDKKLFTPKVYQAWSELMQTIQSSKEVSLVVSVDNLQKLVKNDSLETFELKPLVDKNKIQDEAYLTQIQKDLFSKMPFYEGLLFNKKSGAIRSAIYLDKKIVNTKIRKDYVLEKLIPAIENFTQKTNIELHTSGMPYIRTLNAKTIIDEIGLFIGAALLITSLIFFYFFRLPLQKLIFLFQFQCIRFNSMTNVNCYNLLL
jgi:predicted RND superfamily exporter protein